MGKKKDKTDAKAAKDRQKVGKSISGKKYELSLTQLVRFCLSAFASCCANRL